MGSNSIRSSLCKEDIISTIKLSITSVKDVHVVVEGEDDIRFLNGLLGKTVHIYESFSGKLGVIEIVEYFHNKYKVIGICDKDYDDYENEQMFYYDHSCLETMLISSDKSLYTLCNEYHGCTDNPDYFINEVLLRLGFLGLLRKYNALYKWEINFRGLSIDKLFSPNDMSSASDDIIVALDIINNGQLSIKYNSIKHIIDSEDLSTKERLLDIVNGHDLIKLLSVYFKVKHKKDAGEKTIAGHLRCSFDINEFIKTTLYTTLKMYEQSRRVYLLFA
ncbi:MAG: DUF4435 domain-containing protein [Oscillospiraceae bacterium]|jgi:hypothetical protein|nr:DUF4435 domain-containing protein [Oscillospiraceae bacterium]